MDEARCLRVKRCGLRGSVTKLMGKVEDAFTTELEIVNTESVLESRRILASTIVEQLKTKLSHTAELDEAIAKTIQGEKKLETEIVTGFWKTYLLGTSTWWYKNSRIS